MAPIVITYQIPAPIPLKETKESGFLTEPNQWQLWSDGQLLHAATEMFYIYIYLTREVVAKLVSCCQQAVIFHAAGLAYNGQGIIFCGASESGKSTLAAWLTASGFDFLSDEMLAVSVSSGQMSGLTCPLVLKKESAFVWQHWHPHLTDQDFINIFDGAVWLDPELLHPNCVQSVAFPRLLIFPRYAPHEPFAVQPLSAAQTVFRLMARLISFSHPIDGGLPVAKRLARQTMAYSLTYSEINQATSWINKIITD